MDKVRSELQTSLAVARKPTRLVDPLAGSDDEDSGTGSQPSKKRNRNVALVTASVGSHNVVCLNHKGKLAIKLDTETVKFIAEWIVPLVEVVAHSQMPEAPVSVQIESKPPGAACELAAFHFLADATPNIRDKVLWQPQTHSWKVALRQPIRDLTDAFFVDKQLGSCEYEQEKVAAYWRAVDAWNSCDGSKRNRIPTVRL